MYNKIKKQNGEAFAQTIRNYHNGILEIPGIDEIVRHAGRDATPLLPYLMSLLANNDNRPQSSASLDPFVLLDKAGYRAFHADTLKKQNSISSYFKKGELLCTFGDSARHKNYYIIHAIKKDVDSILRDDFNGKEARQDAYGTSVISIQILKSGGFISIKNRYNHTVAGCDNTFDSNPDKIIKGLSAALMAHFGADFSATQVHVPYGFTLIRDRIFKYDKEENNVYYGDQAWAKDGQIHAVDKSAGDAMFEGFLFDNKTKTLQKIDPKNSDSLADDFNRYYGGNRGLNVQKGNLLLNGELLIGAENSRITTLCLPALTSMSDHFLENAHALTHFDAPALTSMGDRCLMHTRVRHFDAPALTSMGNYCLYDACDMTHFGVPTLNSMGECSLYNANSLTHFDAPALTSMGRNCLYYTVNLKSFDTPSLISMDIFCLHRAYFMTCFNAPALTSMGKYCLKESPKILKQWRQQQEVAKIQPPKAKSLSHRF